MAAPAPSNNDPAAASADSDVISPTELSEAEQYLGKDNFIKLHKTQFMSMRLPAALMHTVYSKLLASQFDALDAFEVQYVEDEGFQMVAKRDLEAGKDVWIIDHLWTTTVAQAPKQLREIDGLMDRLWTLADMDFRMEQERLQRVGAAAAAAAATPAASPDAAAASAAAPAAAAAAAAAPVELDEDSLCAIMSGASVSRDRAVEAYTANKGDLISSITWLAGESERETQMKASMMAMAEAQAAAQGIGAAEAAAAAAPTLAPEDAHPFDNSTLSRDAKADLLWLHLFKSGLVGSYFTTLANDVSQSSLRSEDVQSTLFVNDEVGSAVGQANDAANANACMAPLVAVTLGGVGFSLLWLTQDVKEGDEVLIPKRPTIRLPGVPQC